MRLEGSDKSDKTTPDARDENSEMLKIGSVKSDKTLSGPPSYICRCPQCGGTHWGQTGTLDDAGETWGCLDCVASSASTHGDMCPECHGSNIITDQAGKYCVDCRRRPWERKQTRTEQEPVYIVVRWSSEKGYLELTNPLTSDSCEIVAKGLPRWIFDRMNGK
jgi:hypothetical protein